MMTRFAMMAGLLALAGSAWANELPARRQGLWEITLQDPAGKAPRPVTVQQCTDQASDARVLLSVAPGQESCRRPSVQRGKGSYRVDTACAVHDVPVATRFEFSGDLRMRYQGQYEVRYGKGPRPPESRRFEGRWLGKCPADMRPGDTRLPNGIIVNVLKTHDHDHDHEAGHGRHDHDHDHGRR
ncbi:DUF3617 domain-containing protein [Ottowia sp.]|uniref:DUF3617 domain-containing protein n=1 Tax=Ottowia sp. TaxID=1898956 RepID=UPI0039E64225